MVLEPNPAYSESLLTNTTPAGFTSPLENNQVLSDSAIKELIEKQVEPLWNALRDSMKDRAEMKLRIEKLETSEKNLENEVDFLKNRVENVTHNNEQLVDEVEKMRIENENLKKALNEIGIAGIQRVEQNLNIEKTRERARYQGRVVKKKVIETKNCELEELRKELGVIGGAGHFFGNDKGGVRDSMEEKQFKKVLQLLAAGETKINLKEREFRAFF